MPRGAGLSAPCGTPALPRRLGTRVAAALVTATTPALGGTGLAHAVRSPDGDLAASLASGAVCALVGAGLGTGTPFPDHGPRHSRRP